MLKKCRSKFFLKIGKIKTSYKRRIKSKKSGDSKMAYLLEREKKKYQQ